LDSDEDVEQIFIEKGELVTPLFLAAKTLEQ
jgi:hypothetical protein